MLWTGATYNDSRRDVGPCLAGGAQSTGQRRFGSLSYGERGREEVGDTCRCGLHSLRVWCSLQVREGVSMELRRRTSCNKTRLGFGFDV
jgi:hypothetical protein